MLLEREHTLAVLGTSVADAAAGNGSIVLVTGEAGIGKTTLVRAFVRDADARVLMSACDDLMASRALGPLRDAVLGPGPVDDIFSALLDELASETPTVLVVDDIHWADDATLDVLGYAARRIEEVGAVLVLTFRDDEVEARHPLNRFLGVLSGCPVHRVALAPLSPTAVQRLCEGTGADPARVHRVTRGNPFFVTEALASPADDVPVSVIEAVLARVGRLGPECRGAPDQLSGGPAPVGMAPAVGLVGRRTSRCRWRWDCSAAACTRSPRPSRPACSRSAPTVSRSGTSWPAGRSSRACPRCGASSSTRRSCANCGPRRGPSPRASCTTR